VTISWPGNNSFAVEVRCARRQDGKASGVHRKYVSPIKTSATQNGDHPAIEAGSN
jgi:hypothetical protein